MQGPSTSKYEFPSSQRILGGEMRIELYYKQGLSGAVE